MERYRFFPMLIPPEFDDDNVVSVAAEGYTLNELVVLKEDTFTLLYDFGDGWKVHLRVESVVNKEISLKDVPQVLAGKGFGILENVGDPSGLARVREVSHEGLSEEDIFWLEMQNLFLDHFDREEMDIRIKKLLRMYRESYELAKEPSPKMMKFLLRED